MTNLINNKALAKEMQEICKDYHLYEYEDFLEVFQTVVEKLVMQDKRVKVDMLGVFALKTTKSKQAWDIATKSWVQRDESYTLKFKPSSTLNDKIRSTMRTSKDQNATKD